MASRAMKLEQAEVALTRRAFLDFLQLETVFWAETVLYTLGGGRGSAEWWVIQV